MIRTSFASCHTGSQVGGWPGMAAPHATSRPGRITHDLSGTARSSSTRHARTWCSVSHRDASAQV